MTQGHWGQTYFNSTQGHRVQQGRWEQVFASIIQINRNLTRSVQLLHLHPLRDQ